MEFVAILICLILSGFFSGAEIAFFSTTESRLRAMAESKRWGANLALKLRQRPHRLLTAILIGNNVVNLTAASLVSITAYHHFGSEGVAVATGILTLVVLIFGEIIPKTFCVKHADAAVLLFAYPIRGIEWSLFLIRLPLEKLSETLSGKEGAHMPFKTDQELVAMLEDSHEAGVLKDDEVAMLKKAVTFPDQHAEDVMTPRVSIFGMAGHLTLGEAKEALCETKYSRIPIYDDNLNNVTGILYRTHALCELVKGHHDTTLRALAKPPMFIPEAKSADVLLKQFQERKSHIAVVVNEFGEAVGLVTTEDLLEEVVGEILDETDSSEEPVKRISDSIIVAPGRTPVRKINEELDVKLDDEDQITIGGLIQQQLGEIPGEGDILKMDGCVIMVRDADAKSIKSVQIEKIDEKKDEKKGASSPTTETPSALPSS